MQLIRPKENCCVRQTTSGGCVAHLRQSQYLFWFFGWAITCLVGWMVGRMAWLGLLRQLYIMCRLDAAVVVSATNTP